MWPLLEVHGHNEEMEMGMEMMGELHLVLGGLQVVEEVNGVQTMGRLGVDVEVLWGVRHC